MRATELATEITSTTGADGQSIEHMPQGELRPAAGKSTVWSEA